MKKVKNQSLGWCDLSLASLAILIMAFNASITDDINISGWFVCIVAVLMAFGTAMNEWSES